jgi:RNA polymerase sigma-70 factor (ECF subfamily)
MSFLTETEVIESAKAGNQQAFRILVEKYQGFVYSISYRFIRNEDDREDAVQEIFIRLWKHLDKYDTQFELKSWLGKMASNICLDYLKSAKRINETNKVVIEENIPASESYNIEKEIQNKELQELILNITDNLPLKQRAAFILRDIEMMEVKEVCEILEESAENIKSNLYYARKFIREILIKYYKSSLV